MSVGIRGCVSVASRLMIQDKEERENRRLSHHSPVETIRLPRRRREPVLEHRRDERADLVRDVRPGGCGAEGDGHGGGGPVRRSRK